MMNSKNLNYKKNCKIWNCFVKSKKKLKRLELGNGLAKF